MPYLLDTNVFIEAKNSHYGFDFCPAFWDWLDAANTKGLVFSIEKVRDELIAGDDELAEWAKARGSEFFLPPDDAMVSSLAAVSTWAHNGHYIPAALSQFLQVADYYLVAHSLAHDFVTVTHEKIAANNSARKIKIPDACIGLGIKSMTPYEMLRTERVRFVLGA
jgi:hypothetical protein